MKQIFTLLVAAIVAAIVATVTVWYIYSQQYVQDSQHTATEGIFFKTTLNLKEYKRVSTGNGWLGTFDRYTRSDRHNDVLTIYCNNYCSKSSK